jgi:hypothetical protein
MDRGLLVVMAMSDGSCLTVLAAASCDVAVGQGAPALLRRPSPSVSGPAQQLLGADCRSSADAARLVLPEGLRGGAGSRPTPADGVAGPSTG